jgi:hypothetical protein
LRVLCTGAFLSPAVFVVGETVTIVRLVGDLRQMSKD